MTFEKERGVQITVPSNGHTSSLKASRVALRDGAEMNYTELKNCRSAYVTPTFSQEARGDLRKGQDQTRDDQTKGNVQGKKFKGTEKTARRRGVSKEFFGACRQDR